VDKSDTYERWEIVWVIFALLHVLETDGIVAIGVVESPTHATAGAAALTCFSTRSKGDVSVPCCESTLPFEGPLFYRSSSVINVC